MDEAQKTEIIALASGKGGTGKTLVASCLGYALIRGGHRVLMIDGDPATDGLSLFLLGPKGWTNISHFEARNTFTGILSEFQLTGGSLAFQPRTIHRSGPGDHGISYNVIISGRGLYGDEESMAKLAVPDLDRSLFRAGLRALFDALRKSNEYDYIIVDTRGGFAFESTDVCALADSFIVVTEPDYTSFYQDRNLFRRINQASNEVSSPSVLRAIIVNKATEGDQQGVQLDLGKIERSFRLELTKEFPVRFEDTHPIPADIEALKAYKTQAIPYMAAPASLFSFATLTAFSDILQVVTSRWSSEQVDRWNKLVNEVSIAVAERNKRTEQRQEELLTRDRELSQLRLERSSLKELVETVQREKDRMEKAYDREIQRSTLLLSSKLGTEPDGHSFDDKRNYTEMEARGRRQQVMYIAAMIGACLFAVLSVLGFLGLREWRASHINDLLTQAYEVKLPPALRSQSINELVNRYGVKQFDAIQLENLDLHGSKLEGVSFRSSILHNSDLSRADLEGANFTSAHLDNSDLSGSILSTSNLSSASMNAVNLEGADLRGANLNQTDLRGADLLNAQVDLSQIKLAITDENTKLPPGLSSKPGIQK